MTAKNLNVLSYLSKVLIKIDISIYSILQHRFYNNLIYQLVFNRDKKNYNDISDNAFI